MLPEVRLALVEERHGVGRAIIVGKIPLLVLRMELEIALIVGATGVGALSRGRLLLDEATSASRVEILADTFFISLKRSVRVGSAMGGD